MGKWNNFKLGKSILKLLRFDVRGAGLYLFTLLLPLLFACHSGPGKVLRDWPVKDSLATYPPDRQDRQVAVVPECKTTKKAPFACLQKLCEKTDGQFNADEGLCVCPAGKLFVGYEGKGCTEFSVESYVANSTYHFFFKDKQAEEAGLKQSDDKYFLNYSLSLPFESDDRLGPQAQAGIDDGPGSDEQSENESHNNKILDNKILASELESLGEKLTTLAGLNFPLMRPHRVSTSRMVSLQQISGKSLVGLLKDKEYPLHLSLPDVSRAAEFLHLRKNPGAVKELDQLISDHFMIGNSQLLTDPATHIPIAPSILSALKNAPARYFFSAQDGCLGVCRMVREVQERPSRNGRGPSSWVWEKTYVWGNLVSNTITHFDKNAYTLVREKYFLDLKNQFQFKLKGAPRLEMEGENQKVTYIIQAETGEQTLTADPFSTPAVTASRPLHPSSGTSHTQRSQLVLIPNLSQEDELLSSMRTTKNLPTVVLCDTGILPSKALGQRGLYERLLKGPAQGKYGWLGVASSALPERSFITPLDFELDLSGLLHLSEMGIPQYWESEHALQVATQMSGVQIIPISIKHCFSYFSQWFPLVSSDPYQTKVVNMSFAEFQQGIYCAEEKQWNRQIEATQHKLLWVTGAGNDGLNLDLFSSVPLCPQAILKKSDNGLVVGAAKNGRPHPQSNFGQETVDFFMEANSTSEASGKVSALAARIIDRYELTPAEVKEVFIEAAWDYSKGNKRLFPSKSGGLLIPEKAIAKAEALYYDHIINQARHPSTFKEVTQNHEGHGGDYDLEI